MLPFTPFGGAAILLIAAVVSWVHAYRALLKGFPTKWSRTRAFADFGFWSLAVVTALLSAVIYAREGRVLH
jgi:hypothetical protein